MGDRDPGDADELPDEELGDIAGGGGNGGAGGDGGVFLNGGPYVN